ncbi:hypothetical protein K435DRAFT_872920 [Dendrothele bispora CBS 962.96]|uniref:Uncharacterized protein n=1 Tax=Dendrothele bispora (strain CBS 962.96) TaxID=1314807 RepID=A0A4S8L0F5_DENBC|nr:hypothetical protein K435DRAFT_872920 [Dendrothele bispora CBS 962.96]
MACCNKQSHHLPTVGGGSTGSEQWAATSITYPLLEGGNWVRAMFCCNKQSHHLHPVEGGNTGSEQWLAATSNLITYLLLEGGKHWVRAMACCRSNLLTYQLLEGNIRSEQWPAATSNLITYKLLEGGTLGQSNSLLQQAISSLTPYWMGEHWVRAMACCNNQSPHLLAVGGGNTRSEQWPAATSNLITY